MLSYALKRLALAAGVAFVVSLISFLLIRLGGDPAIALAGEGARSADIELVHRAYRLDRPLPVQYFVWLWHRKLRSRENTSIIEESGNCSDERRRVESPLNSTESRPSPQV